MKIRRFKLNTLSAETLQMKEMNVIIGGADSCGCACAYEGMGGSSFSDNTNANYKYVSHPTHVTSLNTVPRGICLFVGQKRHKRLGVHRPQSSRVKINI